MSFKFERYLSIETAGGATWHPNKSQIAFTSNATGTYQIYTTEIERGKTLPRQQLTDEEDRCTDPRYLADGTIVFTRDRGGDENYQIGLIEEDGSLTWLTSDLEVKHLVSSTSDSFLYFIANISDKARLDAYRWKVPLRKHEPELLLEPDEGIIAVAEASPDETQLLMVRALGNLVQNLLLFDTKTREVSEVTSKVTGGQPSRWDVVRWLNPETVLAATDFKADMMRLAIVSTDGNFVPIKEIERVVKFEIEKYTYSRESPWTFFVENRDGLSTIHRAQFTGESASNIESLTFPRKGVILKGDARSWSTALRLSKDGQMLAVTVSSGTEPTSIWIVDTADMSSWKVVDVSVAGLDPTSFIDPLLHRFDSYDGLSVPYFRFIPKREKPAKGWPALLIIHGGPEAQFRPSFNPVHQFYLSNGFAIIAPNIRGSYGYGRKYLDLDNIEKRLDSILDIKHLALHIKKNDSGINGEQLIIYGGSYGGFAVLSSMTEHPKLWRAGVDIVGISNFVTFLENTADWRRSLREVEYGNLERDRETLMKISPIHKVDNIAAPLFIIQGDNDERVPLSESIQIYEKLKEKGLQVEMLRFADEGHGLAKLRNRKKAYPRVVEWLKTILD